ncbi:MAG: hypothetical protein KAT43_05955 [Nanoarchaeota archaeon]|nr:hypothetical protein [Nanoarchaeota archaeon]
MTTDFMEPDYDAFDSRIEDLCSEGKDNEARDLVRKALETTPDDTDLLIRLGEIYLRMDNILEASKALRRARELGDSDTEIDYLLGGCAFFSEDFCQARKHYDNYLRNLVGPGEAYQIDKDDQRRIAEIGRDFYASRKHIEVLKFFRFIFTHGPLWIETAEYCWAARCLHKFGEKFQEEKYSYIEQAIMYSTVSMVRYRLQYAIFLYDDSNKEKYPEKQQEMADKAIVLFEFVGIENIQGIGTLKKLKFLYRHYRDWNNRTRKKLRQCNRKIEVLENRKVKSKSRKATFKKKSKKDRRRKN